MSRTDANPATFGTATPKRRGAKTVLARLLHTLRVTVGRLELEAVRRQDDHAVEAWNAVRACERELSIVAEAAGLDRRARALQASRCGTPLEALVEAYAASLLVELPRAIRGVLEEQLRRLRALVMHPAVA